MSRNVVIMGAAGRDFHVFNCCYRGNPDVTVVAFTATQIPYIDDRRYPPQLAGDGYPDGIPIVAEDGLAALISRKKVDEVVFAYSDVHNDYVEERRRTVESAGAEFSVFDIDGTMLESSKPVIAVTATRTGCGKSQTSRRITEMLIGMGKRAVAIRHPMPYGDLVRQSVQRFATMQDLDTHECTIEEREEYEPHIRTGVVVYAGVDYAAILEQAQQEADVIVWDGGNNDTPLYKPNLWITVTDPHRPGHELEYFPGRANFERADVIVINKVDSAEEEGIAALEASAAKLNPEATVVRAASPLDVPDREAIRGKRVLVVEDGPTTTHGGMPYGAGTVAARLHEAAKIVDPRQWLTGELVDTFEQYPSIGPLLPAMGYGERQIADLEAVISAADCDLVLIATPIDLTRLIDIDKPHMRVSYRLAEEGEELSSAVAAVAG